MNNFDSTTAVATLDGGAAAKRLHDGPDASVASPTHEALPMQASTGASGLRRSGRALSIVPPKVLIGATWLGLTLSVLGPTEGAVAAPDCDRNPDRCIDRTEPRNTIHVLTPDVAYHLARCLPPFVTEQAIAEDMRRQMRQFVDVRYRCIGGRGVIAIFAIGVDRRYTAVEPGASERGIRAVNLLRQGETFAAFISSRMATARAQEAWNKAPKVLENGKIVLNGFSFSFTPGGATSWVTGSYKIPVLPDVGFRLTYNDRYGVDNGKITCRSSQHLDKNTRFFDTTAVVTSILFPPSLGTPIFIVNALERQVPEAPQRSPGCTVMTAIPATFDLGARLKAAVAYSRVQADVGGVTVGGQVIVGP